jgi:hypothetical protein
VKGEQINNRAVGLLLLRLRQSYLYLPVYLYSTIHSSIYGRVTSSTITVVEYEYDRIAG